MDLSVFDYPFYASVNPQYFTLNKLNTFTVSYRNFSLKIFVHFAR